MASIVHYPRLDTVLMVERTLKEAETAISRSELARRLPKKVMRQTLNLIVSYFEERGMVMVGKKGVLWIHNDDARMRQVLAQSS